MQNFIFRRDEIEAFQIKEEEIKVRIMNDLQRRAEMQERKDILRDNLRQIIHNQLSSMFTPQTYDDMKHYVDATNNVMRRIVRETSAVYKSDPVRTITPKGAQKRYDEIITALRMNEKMQRANYLLNGMNDLIFQVVVLGGVIDISILTPDMVTVFENADNPNVLDAIMIEDAFYDEGGVLQRQWIYWSPVRHFIIDKDYKKRAVDGNPEMMNPYAAQNIMQNAFYPFVTAHAADRENCFWDRFTGRDLVDATKLIAIQSTFRNFMIPMQFKQLSVKMQGIDENRGTTKSNQIKSPLDILTTNGDATVLDWQSDLKQIGDQIQNQIFSIASNYGISAENFKLSAAPVSGFARLIAKERLDEIREEQKKIWRSIEEQLFDAIRMAANVYDLAPISESAKFSIDFAEPNRLEDPIVEVDLIKQRMELGLISPLDVIKEENPDIKTDEEAEAVFQKNLEIRRRLSSRLNINFDEILKTKAPVAQGA